MDRLIDWFDHDGSLSPKGQEDSALGLNPHPKRRALNGRQIERSNKAEGPQWSGLHISQFQKLALAIETRNTSGSCIYRPLQLQDDSFFESSQA